MDDDLYERFAQPAVDVAARLAFAQGVQVGREVGFAEGFAAGQSVGFVAGVNSVAAALSDGTRKGSSHCGKALESLKRLCAVEDVEDTE